VRNWAEEQQIACVRTPEELVQTLGEERVDYLFSVVNLTVLAPEVLRLARKMSINFHDALLPRYAGLHATSWALINRETQHGVTWHEMLADVDRGRILKQRAFPIEARETAVSLNAKCYEAGAAAFAELIDELCAHTLVAQEQAGAERTYFGRYKRPAAACTIAWDSPADEIVALVAALSFGPADNPLGLAKFELDNGEVLAVGEALALASRSEAPPGTITSTQGDALRVTTASNDVALRGLRTLDGAGVSVDALADRYGARPGTRLPALSGERAARLTSVHRAVARHESFWAQRLVTLAPIQLS
jgi:methionyl-tRNA formyltransferase